jgi:hypothetical protein
VQFGPVGIAAAWLVAWPVLTVLSAAWSLPVIGLSTRDLADALLPPVLAGTAMGLGVVLTDRLLPAMPELLRLSLLVAAGAAIYGLWLLRFARGRLDELLATVLKR